MALLEDMTESLFPGALIGIGVAILSPLIIPAAGGVLRPVLKTVVRGGLYVGDKVYEVAAEATEQLSDLVAEVRSEIQEAAAPAEKPTVQPENS